ncbi:MAG: hypothetical protein IKL36_03515 [Clostridia bacterium]|nr:hypothetical protein [Clostridia bacterium]
MITFDVMKKIMAFDIQRKYCVEILFSIDDNDKFSHCWMGKSFDDETECDVYWFGLTPDGKNAFAYPTFEELSSAKVFDKKSLFEIWDSVILMEIDGCNPMERICNYIGENDD